jgi:5-formyltetrahydrofolate cyclo-ligase
MTPAERKALLRRESLARRDALDPAERASASAVVAGKVVALLAGSSPVIVSGFWPIRSEIDPRPLMAALARAGHRTALPSVGSAGLVFRLWTPGEPLVKAGFGLSEPPINNLEVHPDVMLVPLAAFDRRGHRIGYGAGYYDRAIAERPGVRTIGLAFAAQEVERVPDEPHDCALDVVATEADVILPAAAKE